MHASSGGSYHKVGSLTLKTKYMKIQGSGNTWSAYRNDKAANANDSFTGQF